MTAVQLLLAAVGMACVLFAGLLVLPILVSRQIDRAAEAELKEMWYGEIALGRSSIEEIPMPHIRERCVTCGKETEYFMDTPVGARSFYVVGCGQQCGDCYYCTGRAGQILVPSEARRGKNEEKCQ